MRLQELPKWFGWLKNLKFVTLEGNRLETINKEQLPSSIVDLDCFGNSLTSVDVSTLVHLTTLNLGANYLEKIDLANLLNLK